MVERQTPHRMGERGGSVVEHQTPERGQGLETYLRHVVSLSKTLYSSKVLVIHVPPSQT